MSKLVTVIAQERATSAYCASLARFPRPMEDVPAAHVGVISMPAHGPASVLTVHTRSAALLPAAHFPSITLAPFALRAIAVYVRSRAGLAVVMRCSEGEEKHADDAIREEDKQPSPPTTTSAHETVNNTSE